MYSLGFSVWVCVVGDYGSLLSHFVSLLVAKSDELVQEGYGKSTLVSMSHHWERHESLGKQPFVEQTSVAGLQNLQHGRIGSGLRQNLNTVSHDHHKYLLLQYLLPSAFIP